MEVPLNKLPWSKNDFKSYLFPPPPPPPPPPSRHMLPVKRPDSLSFRGIFVMKTHKRFGLNIVLIRQDTAVCDFWTLPPEALRPLPPVGEPPPPFPSSHKLEDETRYLLACSLVKQMRKFRFSALHQFDQIVSRDKVCLKPCICKIISIGSLFPGLPAKRKQRQRIWKTCFQSTDVCLVNCFLSKDLKQSWSHWFFCFVWYTVA